MFEKKYKDKITNYLSIITEFGICLYLFFLFFDKGQTFRDIGLYSSLFSFISLALISRKIKISFNIIDYAFFSFVFSIILSIFFSIEPSASITYFGKDVIKTSAVFFIIAKFFDGERLIRLIKVFCISGALILILGLQGFINDPNKIYSSNNIFLSVNRNEYAFFVSIYIPFLFMLTVKNIKIYKNFIWHVLFLWALCAGILTGSRASSAGILTSLITFILMLSFDKKYHNIAKKILLYFVILILVLSIVVFFTNSGLESIKSHWLSTPEQIKTFNLRTTCFWIPAMDAIKQRPVTGWGYGGKIARDPRPFVNTKGICLQYKGGLHNTFISILFHQGLIGFISFIFLLFSSLLMLIRTAKNKQEEKKLLAISLLSLIIGCFIVTSLALSVPVSRIAPFMGMVSALIGESKNEDSNN